MICRRPPGASPCRWLPILRPKPVAVAAETSGTAATEALKNWRRFRPPHGYRCCMVWSVIGTGGQRRSSLVARVIPTRIESAIKRELSSQKSMEHAQESSPSKTRAENKPARSYPGAPSKCYLLSSASVARIVTQGPTRGSTRLVGTNRNAGRRHTPRGTIRDRTRLSVAADKRLTADAVCDCPAGAVTRGGGGRYRG